ncbi:oligoribonuclease [Halorhodospira abdelmalekii]|uniref:oligoribonuclease n=1 Tax=Halorhodospira abdelmalekii TaxID=421629 RepID=UPI001908C181|nr:oligoribonuclease [Halorhodospira abdelmalekii]MBK1733820.1 oligoribonuclease [Halorhodospira abdelmalekii]
MGMSKWNLVWIDLEMTGLDPQRDRIIEMAAIVTDSNLDVLAESPVLAIHQPESVLEAMDEWNTNQHHKSGLVERVRASTVTEAQAEETMLRFLEQYVPPQTSPMCGNSICQDRRFMARWMPQLEAFFHYRHVDVSTLKELARRWAPAVADQVGKSSTHLALDDVRDSIEELRHYRREFIRLPA